MDILVKAYNNKVKMVCALEKLADMPAFRFLCLRGSVIRKKNTFKCVGDSIMVLISYANGNAETLMAMLCCGNCGGIEKMSSIALKDIPAANVNKELTYYLMNKHRTTGNPWEISFNCGGENVGGMATAMNTSADGLLIEGDKGEELDDLPLKVKISQERGSDELIILAGKTKDSYIRINSLSFVEGLIKGAIVEEFSYSTISFDGGSKTVHVSRSRIEIMRELSHFLNETLVFVSLQKDDSLVEQYVGAQGALEVYMKAYGLRVFQSKSVTRWNNRAPFCVYLTSARVQDIIKEQSKATRKIERGGTVVRELASEG